MTLKEKIQSDIIAHMKSGARFERDTLRYVLGEIQSAEKSGKTPVEFDDLQTEAFINKQVKARRFNAGEFMKAGATDRAELETWEAELLSTYLPQDLTESEATAIVESVMGTYENPTKRDMNSIMKAVNVQVRGRFDGKAISDMVKARLTA